MMNKDTRAFKDAGTIYLSSLSLGTLRTYGRSVGVASPTTKMKEVLIQEILSVLCGEMVAISPSNRGAPVLDNRADERVVARMKSLQTEYLGVKTASEETAVPATEKKSLGFLDFSNIPVSVLTVGSPTPDDGIKIEDFVGELWELDKMYRVMPLDGQEREDAIYISNETVEHYRLRIGDVVSGGMKRSPEHPNICVVTYVSKANGSDVYKINRTNFEEYNACYPRERFRLYEEGKDCELSAKYLEWLAPIGKGQRCCIKSAPKSGKSRLLLDLANSIKRLNPTVLTFVLLVDRTPENVGQFRVMMGENELVYTTFEDPPERQVFTADFLLKRAIRYVESKKDVVLIVDSFNALAKAYDETDESAGGKRLPCGLESKTAHYIKKYFGSARCLECSGSLTIIGAVDAQTGDPADDYLERLLAEHSNYVIELSTEMAKGRFFPALDLRKIEGQASERLTTEEERALDKTLRGNYLLRHGSERLLSIVNKAKSYEKFKEEILRLTEK